MTLKRLADRLEDLVMTASLGQYIALCFVVSVVVTALLAGLLYWAFYNSPAAEHQALMKVSPCVEVAADPMSSVVRCEFDDAVCYMRENGGIDCNWK